MSQCPALQIKTLVEIDQDYLSIVNVLHPRVLQGELSYAEARRERLRRLFALYGQEASSAVIEHAAGLYQRRFWLPAAPLRAASPC